MKIFRLIFFCLSAFLIVNTTKGQNDTITTFAGNGSPGISGDGGLAVNAGIGNIVYGAFDSEGNYYFTTRIQHRLRKVNVAGVITTVAGTGSAGFNGDNGPAINALLNNPTGVAIDDSDNIYISDLGNNRVRKISAGSGIITTVVGNGVAALAGDGGAATNASLYSPCGLYIDGNQNIYIADQSNNCVRRVDASGIITTIAGTGVSGYNGDGQLATTAELSGPVALCKDGVGNLYISDWGNYRVRRIDAITDTITTFVGGIGTGSYNGDGILAADAEIAPRGIVIDQAGTLFVADGSNQRVRMVNTNDSIFTIAGTGVQGYSGDGGPAIQAELNNPEGLSLDSCGNLYICVTLNRRIRKIMLNECEPLETRSVSISEKEIKLYPNPAQTRISISASAAVGEVLIANTVGQVVCRKESKGNGKMELDISDLQPGIYFVTVEDKQGVKVTKKVVKE